MTCHEIAFEKGLCRVEIGPDRDSLGSGHVARMWLVDRAGTTRHALVGDDGRPMEIHAGDEALALSSAVSYLAGWLGGLGEYAHRCPDGPTLALGEPILIDRRRPATQSDATGPDSNS